MAVILGLSTYLKAEELPVKMVLENRESEYIQLYLDGVTSGLMAANSKACLFEMPSKLKMTWEIGYSAAELFAETYPDFNTEEFFPSSVAVLTGLSIMFPCN